MQDNNAIESILKSEYSKEFDEKRKRSMITSYYKYGKAALNYPNNVDAIASLEQRLNLYKQTGNMDYLIDIANFAMLEFMFPRKKDSFYKAIADEKESPDLVGLSVGELKELNNYR